MSKHSDDPEDPDTLREKIIGLGERSQRKSYYPKLRQQVQDLKRAEEELKQAYAGLEIRVPCLPQGRPVGGLFQGHYGSASVSILRTAMQSMDITDVGQKIVESITIHPGNIRQQDIKFVPSDPGHRIGCPDRQLQCQGEFLPIGLSYGLRTGERGSGSSAEVASLKAQISEFDSRLMA